MVILVKMKNCSNETSNCSHLGRGQGLDGPGFGVFSFLICWTSQVAFGTAVRVVFY